jgi:ABC-2 type transport system ATP-binding protein
MGNVGYIPGEIAFPQLKTGMTFLKTQAQFLNVTDLKPTQDMINKFAFDINANLKRMSKGMKQKTAIVESFMNSPDILIFDEPSTGLDPLMENIFIGYVKQQKELGKTIIMSSHIFEEIEECCDEVIMLNEGKVIEHIDMEKIHHNPLKTYRIGLKTKKDYARMLQDKKFVVKNHKDATLQVFVSVYDNDINTFIKNLLHYDITFLTEIKYTLEEHFLTCYKHIIN